MARTVVASPTARPASSRKPQTVLAVPPAAPPAPVKPKPAAVARRRHIDPTTCEREYSTDEVEFMKAMEHYKRQSGRMFPTCSEILEVIRSLGYRKPAVAPVCVAVDEIND